MKKTKELRRKKLLQQCSNKSSSYVNTLEALIYLVDSKTYKAKQVIVMFLLNK